MAMPIVGASQPARQFNSLYLFRKIHSGAAAATSLSGYNHSKPPEAAVAIIPAIRIARNGMRYTNVAFSADNGCDSRACSWVLVAGGLEANHFTCPMVTQNPTATALKRIHPACEWNPPAAICVAPAFPISTSAAMRTAL